jgi:5'-3' exonuclease
MGVPGMFLWLSKINNNFIKNKLETNIDYLMLDLNCKIHPTCFRILKENPDIICIDKIELKMINAIITEIEELINMIKPLKGIYIAVDGVAPAAKIKQQRIRRFKTIADNKLWDNIKKKYNKPINSFNWNNSAITPGTKFMQKLHNKLLEYIKTKSNIIYSSCYEPSEGEHKILQYIKSNIDYSYIIYGLDADLIFLSLASQSNNIYLLRETTFIEPNNTTNDYKYINIELMKEYIYQIIQKKIISNFFSVCFK